MLESKMQEVLIDIAMNAGCLIAEGKIAIYDSREFVNSVVPSLATEFLKLEISNDYIGSIDEFSEIKLIELFGSGE